MTVRALGHKHLWLFFAVTYGFSWAFWIPGALAAHWVSLPTGLAGFLASPLNPAAFGPTLAALLLTLVEQGPKGVVELLKRGVSLRFSKIWLVAILLLPLVVFGGAVLASILAGTRPLDLSVISNPPYAMVAFFVIMFTAGPLQEEFGWRGYALPRLRSRFSALVSSVIVGFFWWLWHLPAVFSPGRFMTDDLLVFSALSLVIVLAAVLFTWIYTNTHGSVLAVILFHASMNWSMWLAMPGMKMDLPTSAFMIGFLAVAVVVVVRVWGAAQLTRESR